MVRLDPTPVPKRRERAHRRGMPEDRGVDVFVKHGLVVGLLARIVDWFGRRRVRRSVEKVRDHRGRCDR